jgi:hypothetical protein
MQYLASSLPGLPHLAYQYSTLPNASRCVIMYLAKWIDISRFCQSLHCPSVLYRLAKLFPSLSMVARLGGGLLCWSWWRCPYRRQCPLARIPTSLGKVITRLPLQISKLSVVYRLVVFRMMISQNLNSCVTLSLIDHFSIASNHN